MLPNPSFTNPAGAAVPGVLLNPILTIPTEATVLSVLLNPIVHLPIKQVQTMSGILPNPILTTAYN
jgi:hypothetical protein